MTGDTVVAPNPVEPEIAPATAAKSTYNKNPRVPTGTPNATPEH